MKAIQYRGGTKAEHLDGDGFIGLPREITIDSTDWTIRVHDGITKGGYRLCKLEEVYTKDAIDSKLVDIISGGTITLDGYATLMQLNNKADLVHSHTEYSLTTHDHGDTYASYIHEHDSSTIKFPDGETLQEKYIKGSFGNIDLSNYVTNEVFREHTHPIYAESDHTHNNYSTTDHTHSIYALKTHTHDNFVTTNSLEEYLKSKSGIDHTHSLDLLKTSKNETIEEFLNTFLTTKDFLSGSANYYNKEDINKLEDKINNLKIDNVTYDKEEGALTFYSNNLAKFSLYISNKDNNFMTDEELNDMLNSIFV